MTASVLFEMFSPSLNFPLSNTDCVCSARKLPLRLTSVVNILSGFISSAIHFVWICSTWVKQLEKALQQSVGGFFLISPSAAPPRPPKKYIKTSVSEESGGDWCYSSSFVTVRMQSGKQNTHGGLIHGRIVWLLRPLSGSKPEFEHLPNSPSPCTGWCAPQTVNQKVSLSALARFAHIYMRFYANIQRHKKKSSPCLCKSL